MSVARIALVGTMGAGKTTIGRALAARLGWRYLDNDDALRAATGLGPAELLTEQGEPALRAGERAALDRSLAAGEGVVIAVAGGTATEPATAVALAGVPVVWLRAQPSTLASRVAGTDRPWLGSDPLGTLARLDDARRPTYAALADLVVDVDGRGVADLVDEIVRRLGLLRESTDA